jgi:UDP-N-acetylglucosamine--N-acetylmuramyl-(pentapeptide) pyrophosphoryl-undecaprenol N-acetylglucosamine transferase
MTTPDGKLHVLLAGGGTGGHVFPALAVGEELAGRGCAVSFAGSPRGFEARVVPERGLAFHPIAARPLVGRGPVGKALALATAGAAAVGAARLVRRLGVDAVLGTGGYASAPAVLGAVLSRRPVLLLEPNARPGFANRRLARWAAGAAVAFGETCRELACPCRATGVPVRRGFFAVPAAVAAELAARGPRLLVLGGSQGALSVNLALPRTLAGADAGDGLLRALPGLRVVHQTGTAHLAATREAYRAAGVPESAYRLAAFIDDVAGAMAEADLVVSRAGALTVAEIAAAGRAAVLVPLTLAEGHQRDNARALERAGAARVVEAPAAGAADVERAAAALAAALAPVLAGLLGDAEALARMGRAARGLARPGATEEIAGWLMELAGGGGPAAASAGYRQNAEAPAGSAGPSQGRVT